MGEEDQIKEEEGKRVNKKVVQEVTRRLCHGTRNWEGRSVLLWRSRRMWKEHRGAGTFFPCFVVNCPTLTTSQAARPSQPTFGLE